MAFLEVKKLTHTYDESTAFVNDAVKEVSFTAEKGEIIGIIGHTGSGKSTLVQHLNGLLKPTAGNIYIDGHDVWEKPSEMRVLRARVGLVFQYPEYQLFEETVFKDIAFGPKNIGLDGDELKQRVLEVSELVGIKKEYLEKSPFDLSGGEKRRVAVAGVMAMHPEIIVFDEPTAGLDPRGREDIMKLITDYRNAVNATVLIISHSMEDMALTADKLLVMNRGSLFMFDTTENVFKNGDRLREIGLNVPMVTRVFYELKKAGLPVTENVFTVDRAVNELLRVKGGYNNA